MSPYTSTEEPSRLSETFHTTDAAPIHRRVEYWREAMSRTFAAMDVAAPKGVCSGTIRSSRLGHVQVTRVDGDPMRAQRSPHLIRRSDDARLVVTLLAGGVATIKQDARTVRLQPGEIVFCDTTRPLWAEFTQPFQTKSLIVPRQLLGLREAEMRRITAAAIRPDTTVGSLLSPFLTRLVDTAATCPSQTGRVLASNAIDLLTMVAEDRLRQETGDTPNVIRLMEIQAFIDRNLTDGPDTGGRSPRQPHLRPLPAQALPVRRHHGQSMDPTPPPGGVPTRAGPLGRGKPDLATVAHTWGFTSASHFSRAFRAVFGMSPAEWRDPAVRGARTPSLPHDTSRDAETSEV
ncbi:AraC family transcriptional regulator [Streptomyces sp900116325]|uniref:AraC-like ligand-binding domain-containing protein n=1 Tax=Streptomyces sp. 900116325 TaxID=3154295 RepID=UPI0033B18A36